MVDSIEFKQGFVMQNPNLANRKIKFNDKFNVLFGPNGSHKSVTLKTIAAFCGIQTGGWSQISDPGKLASNSVSHFPAVYRQYAPGQCYAIVDWDGRPSFYNDSDSFSKNDMTWFFSNAAQSADGITTEAEQMEIMAQKPSSGQYRIHKINRIMEIIKNPPNLLEVPPYIQDKEGAMHEINYIRSRPRNGKITLIFDEPEKALALPKQFELFRTLKVLSNHFQILLATHSPFILYEDGVNIIDMTRGYVNVCKDLIDKQIKK